MDVESVFVSVDGDFLDVSVIISVVEGFAVVIVGDYAGVGVVGVYG